MAFRYPNFSPPISPGLRVPDFGTPGGGVQNLATLRNRAEPWPWLTGYIGVPQTYSGAYVPPPQAPGPNVATQAVNPFTGIIRGLFKG
jgi:hypothetical protein